MENKFGLIADSLHMIQNEKLHVMLSEDVLQGANEFEQIAVAVDQLLDHHQLIIWLTSRSEVLGKARKLGNCYNGRVIILDAEDASYGTRIANLLKEYDAINCNISKFEVENHLGVRA